MGGLPYQVLADWHPKGKVTGSFGLWNEERGAGNRAVIVIDKEGVIRFRETYPAGVLPNPDDILREVEKLG
jgi:alkyl hydroperoxide reductase subunit AhpC